MHWERWGWNNVRSFGKGGEENGREGGWGGLEPSILDRAHALEAALTLAAQEAAACAGD